MTMGSVSPSARAVRTAGMTACDALAAGAPQGMR